MTTDDHLKRSLFLRDFNSIDYRMSSGPGGTEIRITLKYDEACDVGWILRQLQEARDVLQADRARRTETARAARAAKPARKPARALGRSAPPLLLTYRGEGEA